MTFPFQGKVAVITGGGGGIGLALARRFAREDMKIVLSDIEPDALARAEAQLHDQGADVLSVVTDVSNPGSVDELAETTFRHFGGAHVVCNNAGVVPSGRARPVWEYAIEDWHWSLGVNLLGVVNGIRSFVPRMIATGEPGHIVNTLSIAGLISGTRTVPYSASKHAAVRVTEALYASLREAGYPIGVTALCPGLVDTAIYSSERNRPADLIPVEGVAEELPDLQKSASMGQAPDTVAEMTVNAIIEGNFYLLTTDGFDEHIASRSEALLSRRNPSFTDTFAGFISAR